MSKIKIELKKDECKNAPYQAKQFTLMSKDKIRIEEKGMRNFFMFRILVIWESLFVLVYWTYKNKLQILREVRLDQFYVIL